MNVIKDTTEETHYRRRVIYVADRQPEPYEGYTHKGKLWQPECIVAKWDHNQPMREVTVSGPILKQNGQPSQNRGRRTYRGPGHEWYRAESDAMPEWVSALLADSPHTTQEG